MHLIPNFIIVNLYFNSINVMFLTLVLRLKKHKQKLLENWKSYQPPSQTGIVIISFTNLLLVIMYLVLVVKCFAVQFGINQHK